MNQLNFQGKEDGGIKIGLIARSDNSGLGTLSWEFARHIKPHKILLVENEVYRTFPERFKDFNTKSVDRQMTQELKEWLTDGIDILLTLETFYDWSIIHTCREKKVKSVLYTMYEMTRDPVPMHPDWYLCPSKLDYEVFKDRDHVKYLPVPVATDRIIWKQRTHANHFIHSASHGGIKFRKGTPMLLEAMKSVKSDIRLTIYSWQPFTTIDPRVEVKVVNFKNYWQIWREGDVLVYPQDYNGIALPVVEALASGLGVMTTDIFPFNEYVPNGMLFGHDGLYRTRAGVGLIPTDAARMNPKYIAEKIDEWAGKDISELSLYGKEWAEQNSWSALLPKYVQFFQEVASR